MDEASAEQRHRAYPLREGDPGTRVLLVGKGAPECGGIPSFLELLLSSDLADSHGLRLLNLSHGDTPQGGQPTIANIVRSGRDAVALWRMAGEADVVHIHSALAPTVTALRAGLLAFAARMRGCRVVVHAHGGLLQLWLTSRIRRLAIRVAMAPVHRVVAVSDKGVQVLRMVLGEHRVALLDNGVDIVAYTPAGERVDHQPPRVLYVGILTPRKGLLDLLQASRTLRSRGVDHELWLIGGTPDEGPAAEAEVRAAVNREDARLLGIRTRSEMPDLYRSVDVYCLPSWWEAMPLSVLEAMAAGLPVVATDVGDLARAIRPEVTGLLVSPRSPGQLADALERVLANAEARRAMGAAGRQLVVDQFSSRATITRLAGFYDEVGSRQR